MSDRPGARGSEPAGDGVREAADGARRLTSAAAGAVAVLEVRGEEACARLAGLAGRALPGVGALRLAPLALGDELLDEALLVGRPGGRVEVHLHGGPAVVARVIDALGGPGSSSASPTADPPGGPGRPAARAAAALPHAPSEDGARILLDQADGALEAALRAILGRPAAEARAALADLAERGRRARPLLVAPRVVLAGPTNAGKSTLFNVLLGRERALTSEVPGTTRDAVVEPARLGKLGVELVDTAGERAVDPTEDAAAAVESAGQALAADLRRSADLVLWLTPDGSAPPPGSPAATVALLRPPGASACDPARGALAPLEDPAGSRALVAERVARALPHEGWRPGRAVPFEPTLVERVEALAAESDDARRDAGLARLCEGTDPTLA